MPEWLNLEKALRGSKERPAIEADHMELMAIISMDHSFRYDQIDDQKNDEKTSSLTAARMSLHRCSTPKYKTPTIS